MPLLTTEASTLLPTKSAAAYSFDTTGSPRRSEGSCKGGAAPHRPSDRGCRLGTDCDDGKKATPNPQDQVERAILDVEYASEEGRRWIDVTVRHPAAGDNAAVRAACRRDGEATRRAERSKHQRYPGPQLTAFALEAPGRVGAEAKAWLLNEVRQLPPDTQTKELARAYRVVSCALQTEVVRQLRKAAGLR